MKQSFGLVNAKVIVKKAFEQKYAVPHININNLEWTKSVLLVAQEYQSPIILGTSEGAVKYMGGFRTVLGMVSNMVKDLEITVPVVLHLDHGTYEGAKKAIEVGYPSVMFDGSHFPFEDNFQKSREIIRLAKPKNVSVEIEIGTIGGEEDGVIGQGELANLEEVTKMVQLQPDMLASGIGNIHGSYPKSWKSLDFSFLGKLKERVKFCLVLHGGSGIPKEQVTKAIKMGIAKVNVNTELQIANAKAIREFVKSGQSEQNKNYDPRKFLAPGCKAMMDVVREKIVQFGSKNKA